MNSAEENVFGFFFIPFMTANVRSRSSSTGLR